MRQPPPDQDPESVTTARRQLLLRYGRAVHRYLLGALRDADAADELSQESALRFLRGGLRGADSQRGRFRTFLKGVLCHLVADYSGGGRASPSFRPALFRSSRLRNGPSWISTASSSTPGATG
jgi:DNA-directed RNA polymerase specialized sigma24 family protein